MGEGGPPIEAVRASVCERMGWTFEEFNQTSAGDIFVLLELWRLESLNKK